MLRKEYMACRHRCKKLARKKTKLERAIQLQSTVARACDSQNEWEYLDQLMKLHQQASVFHELLQLDAWEARQACRSAGIGLPPPKKSEAGNFEGLTPDQRKALKERLEIQSDADVAALASEEESESGK